MTFLSGLRCAFVYEPVSPSLAASFAGQCQQLVAGTERHGPLYPGSRIRNVAYIVKKGEKKSRNPRVLARISVGSWTTWV